MVRRRAGACSRRSRRGAYQPPVLHNNKTREDNILPYTMTGKRSGGSPFASKCAPALRYEIDFSAKVAEPRGNFFEKKFPLALLFKKLWGKLLAKFLAVRFCMNREQRPYGAPHLAKNIHQSSLFRKTPCFFSQNMLYLYYLFSRRCESIPMEVPT